MPMATTLLNNKKQITAVSFMSYFVMSGMLAPIGIISGPIATRFGKPITEVTAQFGWLTFGILIGAITAVLVFDWIQLKKLVVLLYTLIVLSLLSLNVITDLTMIGMILGVVGVCCGLGLAAAALVISKSYDADRRASMLVITDSFFSIAGFVCAGVATWLVAREMHWAGVYQFVAVIAATIVLLTLMSVFPATVAKKHDAAPGETWPLSVWFCIVALFLYTLGQYSMLWWLPNYTETMLGATADQAGKLVTLFWIGMFAAAVLVAWGVMKVGVRRVVMTAGITTSLFSAPLWIYDDIDGLHILAFLWGFANLSLLKMVLSFATQMVRVPTPRLVSSLLLGATMGTAVSPFVTSRIVVATDNYFILQFSTACYVTLTILLIAAARITAYRDRSDHK